jgi:hypothetical protein
MDWMHPITSLANSLSPWGEWILIVVFLLIEALFLTCSDPPIINLKRLKRILWQRKGIERRRARVMPAPTKEQLK